MTHELIPTQTGLTLRRTDTLINITNKLLAQTGIKGISQMSDDELWEWWLSLDDKWKFLFLRRGLKLKLWIDDDGYDVGYFNENFDYQVGFDWFDKELTFVYVKAIQNLTGLDLSENPIQDISALANLTNLTSLYLHYTQIQDISLLANLTNLTSLYLSDNQIQDISALVNLTNLTKLYLSENQIQDISVLASLINLKYLDLSENPINLQDIYWLQQKLPNCEIIF
jgi:leucine-rich repeat-containing protein